MDRNELTLAIAGALVGAFLLGWILRWFFGRMNAAGPRSVVRTADMAAQLHAAEEARGRAEWRAAEVAKAEAATEEIRAAYRKALIGGTGQE